MSRKPLIKVTKNASKKKSVGKLKKPSIYTGAAGAVSTVGLLDVLRRRKKKKSSSKAK